MTGSGSLSANETNLRDFLINNSIYNFTYHATLDDSQTNFSSYIGIVDAFYISDSVSDTNLGVKANKLPIPYIHGKLVNLPESGFCNSTSSGAITNVNFTNTHPVANWSEQSGTVAALTASNTYDYCSSGSWGSGLDFVMHVNQNPNRVTFGAYNISSQMANGTAPVKYAFNGLTTDYYDYWSELTKNLTVRTMCWLTNCTELTAAPQGGTAPSTLMTDLVSILPFDTSFNSSNGAWNATVSGTPIINTSTYKWGTGAVQFYGSVGYIDWGQVPLLGNSSYTINTWVYLTSTTGSDSAHQILFSKFNTGATRANPIYFSSIDTADANKPQILVGNGVSHANPGAAALNLQTGQWYMLTWKYEGGTSYSLYINGVRNQSLTSAQAVSDGALSLSLGAVTNGLNGYMKGLQDEVAVWSRNLTDAEITELYGDLYPWNTTTAEPPALMTISLVSPATAANITGNNTNFTFSVAGRNSSYNCSLLLNNSIVANNLTTLNNTNTVLASGEQALGTYNWNVNCTLNATVINTSAVRTINFLAEPAVVIVKNISGFGDSITAGTLLGAGEEYCTKIGALSDVNCVNWGTAGDNTYQLLARMANVLSKGYNYTIVLVGTNDLNTDPGPGDLTTIDQYYANIINITQQLKNDNQKVILSTIPPMDSAAHLNPADNQTLVIQRNSVIRKVSHQLEVGYADIYGEVFNNSFTAADFVDSVNHPSAAAQSRMNSTYYSAIINYSSYNCIANWTACYNTSAPSTLLNNLTGYLPLDIDYNDSNGTYNASPINSVVINTTNKKFGAGSAQMFGIAVSIINWSRIPINPNEYSMCTWLYQPTKYGSDSSKQPIFSEGGAPYANPLHLTLVDSAQSDRFYFLTGNGASHAANETTASLNFPLNSWFHICFKKDSGNYYYLFVNGGVNTTWFNTQAVTDNTILDFNLGGIFGGAWGSANIFFDEVGLWSRNLTAAEISEVYGDAYPFDSNVTVSGDTTPPANITNLQSPSLNNQSIYINWTNPADSDFNHTEVWNGQSNVANVSQPTANYNVTGLTNNTAYTLIVRPVDYIGNIGSNTSITNTTAQNPDSIKPVVIFIGNETTTNVSTLIRVNTSTEAANLTVLWGTAANSLTNTVTNTSRQLSSVVSITGLSPDITYYYNTTVCDGASNCQNNGTFNFTTWDTQPPGDITSFTNNSQNNVSVYLTWSNPGDSDYNKTEVCYNTSSISFICVANVSQPTANYNLTGLGNNTIVTVQARPYDFRLNRGNTSTVTTTTHQNPGNCGNGVIDVWQEECDGSLLNGATCANQGYDGGTLLCGGTCFYDYSGCVRAAGGSGGTPDGGTGTQNISGVELYYPGNETTEIINNFGFEKKEVNLTIKNLYDGVQKVGFVCVDVRGNLCDSIDFFQRYMYLGGESVEENSFVIDGSKLKGSTNYAATITAGNIVNSAEVALYVNTAQDFMLKERIKYLHFGIMPHMLFSVLAGLFGGFILTFWIKNRLTKNIAFLIISMLIGGGLFLFVPIV